MLKNVFILFLAVFSCAIQLQATEDETQKKFTSSIDEQCPEDKCIAEKDILACKKCE